MDENKDLKKLYTDYENLLKDFKEYTENYEGNDLEEDFYNEFRPRYEEVNSSFLHVILKSNNELAEDWTRNYSDDYKNEVKKVSQYSQTLNEAYTKYRKISFGK